MKNSGHSSASSAYPESTYSSRSAPSAHLKCSSQKSTMESSLPSFQLPVLEGDSSSYAEIEPSEYIMKLNKDLAEQLRGMTAGGVQATSGTIHHIPFPTPPQKYRLDDDVISQTTSSVDLAPYMVGGVYSYSSSPVSHHHNLINEFRLSSPIYENYPFGLHHFSSPDRYNFGKGGPPYAKSPSSSSTDNNSDVNFRNLNQEDLHGASNSEATVSHSAAISSDEENPHVILIEDPNGYSRCHFSKRLPADGNFNVGSSAANHELILDPQTLPEMRSFETGSTIPRFTSLVCDDDTELKRMYVRCNPKEIFCFFLISLLMTAMVVYMELNPTQYIFKVTIYAVIFIIVARGLLNVLPVKFFQKVFKVCDKNKFQG